jgi:hypothetical protein
MQGDHYVTYLHNFSVKNTYVEKELSWQCVKGKGKFHPRTGHEGPDAE